MESTQELRHWGIKGQKWGIRRYQNPDGTLTEAGKKRYYYQNPDGSLTEAGKKDYMKAAKKGKLDVTKLSDNDLNMINSRFAREKTFKQNVSDYEKSTFKYRLKEAALARIKGSGGGGGGKGKGGGSGIAKMLAMPIKKAFTDAFTESKGGKGNKGGDDEDEERREARDYRRWKKHGRRFTDHYVSDLKDEQVSKALRNKDVDRGRLYLGHKKGKMDVDDSVGRLGVTDATRNGTDYMQRRLEERRAAREAAKDPALKAQRREENRQRQEAAARRRERELEERAKKSGIIIGHSAIVVRRNSSDELYHWGIKGQRWGIRRFQNEDGTLTEAGRQRYMYDFGSGRKMSLVGKLKFSKDVRQKTEADEHSKFEQVKSFVDDVDSRSAEMQKKMKDFDKLDPQSKKQFGNKILDEIQAADDWFSKSLSLLSEQDGVAKWEAVQTHKDALDDWMRDRVSSKSGTSWSGKSVTKAHANALAEYNKAKASGDSKQEYDAGHKLVSVGLRDIGFEDTFENRKRCWQYFFEDEYPWVSVDKKGRAHTV